MQTIRRRLRAAVVLAGLVGMVVSLTLPAGAQSGNEERRLRDTRAKIASIRAEIEQARGSQAQDAAALAEADQQVAEVMAAVNAAEQAVERQQHAVEEARRRLDALTQEVDAQNRRMAGRAVEVFRQGSATSSYSAILAAATPQEALERSTFVTVLARADRRLLETTGNARVALDAQRGELGAQEQILARVLEEQQALLAEVEAIRNDRAFVLAASTQQLDNLVAQERYLESESRQLAAVTRRQARQAAPSRSSAAPRAAVAASGWVWPARGPVTSEFGRRWGRVHEGIDIGGPIGSPVLAARSGSVSYTGRMGGYGNMTLIDHGGGIVTAYAHQSSIGVRVGQQVSAGQRIGSIGCTGSCTGPHLHFEVRVSGSPRNPRNYLP
jgi:murein DD-endopeptidase MepM/ murein hydrolase activator NlpD